MCAFNYVWSLLVTWRRWWSYQLSHHSRKPMIHANFIALRFTEPELLHIKVLHWGNRDFLPFCCCDLDLDQITFIYKLDLYSLKIYRMCENELPMSRLSKVIMLQTYRQIERHSRNYISHHFAGSQLQRSAVHICNNDCSTWSPTRLTKACVQAFPVYKWIIIMSNVECCWHTWKTQERSCKASGSHWSMCGTCWAVIFFSFVNDDIGKLRHTTCSHATNNQRIMTSENSKLNGTMSRETPNGTMSREIPTSSIHLSWQTTRRPSQQETLTQRLYNWWQNDNETGKIPTYNQ